MVKLLNKIYSRIFPSRQARRVAPWLAINGDKTLRLNYDLTAESVVFDVGGYEGQWTSDIFAKYVCQLYVFEPIKDFAENIKQRFANNPKIKIFNFGLAGETKTVKMSVDAASSSVFKSGQDKATVDLVDIAEFLKEHNIDRINLLKINIEGGEYELLERLIALNWLNKIDNLQIQFHDFVPDAAQRMKLIQERLSQTHHLTYHYEFVWENWQIN